VPDVKNEPNLSGRLGHLQSLVFPVKYIGPLSRLHKYETEKVFDLMVLLSGPEPQRSTLETLLLKQLKSYNGRILFVKGQIEDKQTTTQKDNIIIKNFMQSQELEQASNSSAFIISRSGYTTIMDLARLGKKAFFIPTPGQFEQEYLANRLQKFGLIPYCKQSEFTVKKLEAVSNYKGFSGFENNINFKDLFNLF